MALTDEQMNQSTGPATKKAPPAETPGAGRISNLENEVSELKVAVVGINGILNDILDAIAKQKTQAIDPTKENLDVGLAKNPSGHTVFKNPFDPTAMVEIAIIPPEGYVPQLKQFPDPNDKSGLHLLSYNFRTDEKGNYHYYLPRQYAAAQLSNRGGVKTVLVFPDELPVVVKGPKMMKQTVVIKADSGIRPIFERE